MECPHCKSPIDLAADDTVREVVCPGCGSSIEVDEDGTESFRHQRRRLGRFELLEQLGVGAFGAVYKARDTELDRLVAIKLPRSGKLASKEDVDRFEREARAVAQLKHPSIVSVLDASACEGVHFLVSEFIAGTTLADRLQTSRLEFRAAVELVAKVAEAVNYAHRHGIIHRDLKPSNIMIDMDGCPHVMDFGLAKREVGETKLTLDGQVLGTPAYMSPEQARGQAHAVDARSDVYSLGVILYEILTGELPFRGNKRMLIMQVLQDDPRPLRRLNDLIPRDLETIALRCLAKEPSRRYASAQDLAAELQRWLRGEPIHARPIGSMERLCSWARRNPSVASLAAVVLLLLTSIAIGSTLGMLAIDAQRAEIDQKKQQAETDRDRARESESDAKAARNAAIAARDDERRLRYASDLLMASRSIYSGPIVRAEELLASWTPERQGGKEFRGTEWHLLKRQCDTSTQTFHGHRGSLRALACTKNGKLIASAGQDRVIRLWNARTGRCTHSLLGHSGGVFDLAFSPDETQLASASADATVRLWDVSTGQTQQVLRGHILPVYAVAFQPDGTRLATAGGDTVIKFWDVPSGAELFNLQGHDAAIGRLQFDSAGTMLASSGIIRGTVLWELSGRTRVDRLNVTGDLVLTPDFKSGACGSTDGEIRFLNLDDKSVEQGDLGLTEIHAIDMDPRGRIVAIAGSDGAIHVIDRQTSTRLLALRGHLGPVRRLSLSPDAQQLVSVADDGTVRIWDLPDPTAVPFAGHHEHNVTAAQFSSDGRWLATGDYLGSIALWDSVAGRRVQILGRHFMRRRNDTKPFRIGTGETIGIREVLQHRTGYAFSESTNANPIEEVFVTQGHGGAVQGLAFTPDRKMLVSVGGQDLVIWDTESGRALLEFEHPTLVSALAISPDGALAATACWDDIIRLFEIPSGKFLRALEGHADDVMCLAFHPEGTELASGGRDRHVILWNVANGQALERLQRHTNTVSAIAYAPDGSRLVSAGMDQNIHVWSRNPAHWEATLHGHLSGVTSLEFSGDGSWLVSACDEAGDPAARVWLHAAGQFRECLQLSPISRQGITAVAVHPTSSALVMGRGQLQVWEASPRPLKPTHVAPDVLNDGLQAIEPVDLRLKVLGYSVVDRLSTWPGGAGETQRPREPSGKFLVVVSSLPFGRLKLTDEDYQKLMDRHAGDDDFSQPLKSSGLLIYPQNFSLIDSRGQQRQADFVGRLARAEEEGFEFMQRGVSLLENLTATPAADDRQVVCLAWELNEGDVALAKEIRYRDDSPVRLAALVLETLRPGKPYHPSSRSFDAGEAGHRLRSNLTRFPGL